MTKKLGGYLETMTYLKLMNELKRIGAIKSEREFSIIMLNMSSNYVSCIKSNKRDISKDAKVNLLHSIEKNLELKKDGSLIRLTDDLFSEIYTKK